jgi:hypothetical protein
MTSMTAMLGVGWDDMKHIATINNLTQTNLAFSFLPVLVCCLSSQQLFYADNQHLPTHKSNRQSPNIQQPTKTKNICFSLHTVGYSVHRQYGNQPITNPLASPTTPVG